MVPDESDEPLSTPDVRQEIQRKIVEHAYSETIGKGRSLESYLFDPEDIANRLGIALHLATGALGALRASGEIIVVTSDFGGETYILSRVGVQNLELEERGTTTQTVVHQNFNAPVGSVQTGDGSVAFVNQDNRSAISEALQSIVAVRTEIGSLPDGLRGELEDELGEIEEELATKKPNLNRRKRILRRLSKLRERIQGFVGSSSSILKLFEQIRDLWPA